MNTSRQPVDEGLWSLLQSRLTEALAQRAVARGKGWDSQTHEYEGRVDELETLLAALTPSPDTPEPTAEQIEDAAWAMARVIANRHGHKPDDWMNDERREEARAAAPTLLARFAELLAQRDAMAAALEQKDHAIAHLQEALNYQHDQRIMDKFGDAALHPKQDT